MSFNVIKRNGQQQKVYFDKITQRIEKLCDGLDLNITELCQMVIQGLHDNIKTTEIDELSSRICASKISENYDFNTLGSRICVSNLHKTTLDTFQKTVEILKDYVFLSFDDLEWYRIEQEIDYSRDYLFDYFGIKTLCRAYLMKMGDQIIERPQHMWMRVALGIHGHDLPAAFETYHALSLKYFTHATPTLFHAGTKKPQCSSCFLLSTEDSVKGMYKTNLDCALISAKSGGIGLHVNCIRANGSEIKGTNGVSKGLPPLLKSYNQTMVHIDQAGRRPGSCAIFIEPWHADIYQILELRKPVGRDNDRARDLFYAMWIPDLFMKRVKEDGIWSLMCPYKCPGLADAYGQEFEDLYIKYEQEKRFNRQINARDLFEEICKLQIETGVPYICYKDHVNRKCNQKNLGTIKSSNLCVEITLYSDNQEYGVCNLASISLPTMIQQDYFDFDKLVEITKICVRNLNRVIDINYYPTPETKRSNVRHRPIGIGVQGLADTFAKLGMAFESEEAFQLNRDIFKTIYLAALEESCRLAREHGPYETFRGSPASQGILQPDLWGDYDPDFDVIKEKIKIHGLRNSMLVALMPTASTSQILGNYESFEPFTSNMYTRKTIAGNFTVLNKHMVNDLKEIDMWTLENVQEITAHNGSVQSLDIPQFIKDRYKTVWEIKQKSVIDMAADRGKYICHSQSMNIHLANATYAKLSAMHFYGWEKGLKTGVYYVRSKPATNALKVTLDSEIVKKTKTEHFKEKLKQAREASEAGEDCLMCSG